MKPSKAGSWQLEKSSLRGRPDLEIVLENHHFSRGELVKLGDCWALGWLL